MLFWHMSLSWLDWISFTIEPVPPGIKKTGMSSSSLQYYSTNEGLLMTMLEDGCKKWYNFAAHKIKMLALFAHAKV